MLEPHHNLVAALGARHSRVNSALHELVGWRQNPVGTRTVVGDNNRLAATRALGAVVAVGGSPLGDRLNVKVVVTPFALVFDQGLAGGFVMLPVFKFGDNSLLRQDAAKELDGLLHVVTLGVVDHS